MLVSRVLIKNKLDGSERWVVEGQEFTLVAGEYIAGSEQSQQQNEFDEALAGEGILIGDAIKWITSKMGVKQCPACAARQELLNEYHRKGKAFLSSIKEALKGNT